MQHEFYTSCIKVNGIPLLPPLMTDSIKEEMKHYRSLAVKVEEKLKDRQSIKRIKDKCVQADIAEPMNQSKNITKYSSDSDLSSNYNTNYTSDTNNSDSHSKVTIIEHESVMPVASEVKDKLDIQSPMSDTQHSQHSQVSSINDVLHNSEPATTKTDQAECRDTMMETSTPNEEVISENWKPKVPKTLNIVPITLNDKCEKDHIEPLPMLTKESEQPPKLSRQGSYVLDTPSPMLLAHMHTELTDKNYVPTPTTVNLPQRKQWNITQSKVEWENKQFPAEDTETHKKLETTQESNFQCAESVTSTDSYHTNKSADDSTKAMIVEEDTGRSDITSNEHNHTPSIELKDTSTEKVERDDNVCVLNLVNKLQEAAAIGNSPETRSPRADEKTHDDRTKEHRDPLNRSKSSITSEKLLTVYREIEEMHKKQMMELIDRQRKEQSLLQAEFQKQQMLLLVEIQKCSTGLPYQVSEASSVASDATREVRQQQVDVSSPRSVHADVPSNDGKSPSSETTHANVVMCPLSYISPKNLYMPKHHKSPLYITDTSSAALTLDFARQMNLREAVHNDSISSNNNNNVNDENDDDGNDNSNSNSNRGSRYKTSNVNRQLFPLDSNTTHVPVLDTSVYHEKHVRGVNTINAYARGYLTRRLMRTERVITLKKIYKEALHCMLKLHVDAPLNLAEVNFLHRLQLQCDAASLNLVELFAQVPAKRMKVIAQDRELQQSRTERPTSARSYSFATQKTLARKNLKEFESTMTKYQRPLVITKNIIRSRCQTWTSDMREKLVSPNTLRQSIRRSTSTGTVRKPWR